MKIVISIGAESDLLDIWMYTCEQWGDEKADSYIDYIFSAIQNLEKFPFSGVSRDEILEGTRALILENHLVYYKLTHNSIFILRIMHKSADEITL